MAYPAARPERGGGLRGRLRSVPALLSWRPRHPAQVFVAAFTVAVLASTALLLLPASTSSGDGAPLVTALFTATSAVCVTGLVVVDTGSYWSGFGQAVILGSFQIGGFGIMTLASLLGLVVSRRLGLRTRLLAQAETKALSLGDVRQVIRGVAVISFTIEAVIAAVLVLRLLLAYDMSPAAAAYEGVFHAVSAFNNAGFVLYADSLTRYVTDPWVSGSVAIGVALGSLGFPVLFELRRELRSPHLWSLHTKITLTTTALLLVGGTAAITAFEWTNSATLGPLNVPGKLLAGWFQGTMPRSGGFNTVDYSQMNESTWLVTDVLMFIGGGSASTAGGIKVTTFMVLFFAIIAEARGDSTVDAFNRRLPTTILRQAVTVALLSVAAVVSATLLLLAISGLDLDRVLFEVISAFGTVGLSTGITSQLPDSGQYLLTLLMFAGRIGPATLASALAVRQRRRLYRLPEERPIVG